VITDYRPSDDAHCIVYEFNTSKETFEWFSLAAAEEGRDWRMSESPPIDLFALANQGAAAGGGGGRNRGGGGARDRTGGGGARNRTGASHRHHPGTALRGAASSRSRPHSSSAHAKTPADFNWERKRVPFESHYFSKKLAELESPSAIAQESLSALLTLRAILDARARQIAKELAALNQLDGAPVQHPPGRQPPTEDRALKIHVDDLAAAEAALRAELADIAAVELEVAAAAKAKAEEEAAKAKEKVANGVEVAKESGGDGGGGGAEAAAAAAPAVPAPAATAAPASASEPPTAAPAPDPTPAPAAAEPVPMATDG
jgi:hypothetical protein